VRDTQPYLALLAASACSDDQTPAASMKSYRHPVGLTLQTPASFTVKQTASGFIFKPADSA